MERDEIIDALGKALLLDIECVIDDVYVIRLRDDNKIELVDLKVSEKVYKYLRKNHMTFEFPECIDIFAESCLNKLPIIVSSYFYQNYCYNYKIGFYFKFPSHLTELYTSMFSDFGLYDYEHVTVYGFLGENIIKTNILNTLLYDLKCVYFPSMNILNYKKNVFGYINDIGKDCMVYFKDFIGTMGTLLIYDEFRDSEYKESLNVISKCIENQFLNNQYYSQNCEYVYNEIFGIGLYEHNTSKSYNPGVNITLLYIPGLTLDSDTEMSNAVKEMLNSGIIKVDNFINEIDNFCFRIPSTVQNKLNNLSIELPRVLQKLEFYTFKNLKILKTLTIQGTPIICRHCVYGCDNLESINCKDYTFDTLNVNGFICNDSVKLNLLDWSGTIGEFKKLKQK